MNRSVLLFGTALVAVVISLGRGPWLFAQEAPAAPLAEPPPVPQGVEVLARGPVHEAFATPTSEPMPTQPVPKQPPQAIQEMPPDEKPVGNVAWIAGYWSWDDDRKDFLWVSGIWRTAPPGKTWVPGYWREDAGQWQWVPGFWTAAAQQQETAQEVTYLPAPPAPPEVAAPGTPPSADTFYVPGQWAWQGNTFAWRAGYWARVQPGYVWVSAHYRWTPSGYLYIPGYWDLAVAQRGVLFAPVYIDSGVVTASFVYTPAYVVHDTILVDSLFVRPCCCHYYFGDYYGPAYVGLGFESCVVYSRRHYDSIYVYATWEHRSEPAWVSVQLDLTRDRHAGRAPLPPRTLIQQNTIVQRNVTNVNVTNVTNVTNVNNVTNNTTNVTRHATVNNQQVLAPVSQMSQVKGVQTQKLDPTARAQVAQQAQTTQQVVAQRKQTEVAPPAGKPIQPRVAKLSVPPVQPAGAGGSRPPAANTARPATSSVQAGGAAPHGPPGPGTPSSATGVHPPPTSATTAAPPVGGTHPPNATAGPHGAPQPGMPGQPHPATAKPLPPKPQPPQRPPQRPPPPKKPDQQPPGQRPANNQ